MNTLTTVPLACPTRTTATLLSPAPPLRDRRQSIREYALVLLGIILAQFVLYGPALCGRKVLLPLEVLGLPGVYLPRTPEIARIAWGNIYMTDPVFQFEPMRHFAAGEIRAGRFPAWLPYEFCGAPFIEPRFSPFAAVQFASTSPVTLAWSQLLVAVVAGLGFFAFCRRAVAIRFWPAAIAAWCYPLTAFFIYWEGYTITTVVCWLPWSLLAVEETIAGRLRWAPLGLALVTCLVLLSGHLDISGQVLLASGLFALWRLGERWWTGRFALGWPIRTALLKLAAAWTLGLMLAAPQVLPMLEYAHTGARMERRLAGEEARPPIGLTALPQTVLPDMYGGYGKWSIGNFRFADDNALESSAAGYTGIVATLLVAPLAWCSRRHRSWNLFWLLLALLGLSWCLNLPGFVQVLRLPGLNMMSHNRLVFWFSFAVLALAATGLEALSAGTLQWFWGISLTRAVLIAIGLFCVYRALVLPEPLATHLANSIRKGQPILWIHDLEGVKRVQDWFGRYYWQGAQWCAASLLGLFVIWRRPSWRPRLLPVLGAVLIGDLLLFAQGRSTQCSPELYFPHVKVLDELAPVPGRIIGYASLPATLSGMCALNDVRGYDAVDPDRMVELLQLAADPNASNPIPWALTEFMSPRVMLGEGGNLRLSPVLDLLGVRYVIFRKPPFPDARPAFQGDDYWAMENRSALPRVFVPDHVEVVADKRMRLTKLAAPDFNPLEVAYLETTTGLPAHCQGSADLVRETPTQITIATHAATPSLVVLADRFDAGWRAEFNGAPAPILQTDHAVRGVVVPPGDGKLVFRYAPASFAWGLRLCALAIVLGLAWLGLNSRSAKLT